MDKAEVEQIIDEYLQEPDVIKNTYRTVLGYTIITKREPAKNDCFTVVFRGMKRVRMKTHHTKNERIALRWALNVIQENMDDLELM